MLPVMFPSTPIRRRIRKRIPNLKPVGEPDAGKLARPVRRGAVGKVLLDSNSLAAYPTRAPCHGVLELPSERVEGSFQEPSNASP